MIVHQFCFYAFWPCPALSFRVVYQVPESSTATQWPGSEVKHEELNRDTDQWSGGETRQAQWFNVLSLTHICKHQINVDYFKDKTLYYYISDSLCTKSVLERRLRIVSLAPFQLPTPLSQKKTTLHFWLLTLINGHNSRFYWFDNFLRGKRRRCHFILTG